MTQRPVTGNPAYGLPIKGSVRLFIFTFTLSYFSNYKLAVHFWFILSAVWHSDDGLQTENIVAEFDLGD